MYETGEVDDLWRAWDPPSSARVRKQTQKPRNCELSIQVSTFCQYRIRPIVRIRNPDEGHGKHVRETRKTQVYLISSPSLQYEILQRTSWKKIEPKIDRKPNNMKEFPYFKPHMISNQYVINNRHREQKKLHPNDRYGQKFLSRRERSIVRCMDRRTYLCDWMTSGRISSRESNWAKR